MRHPPIDPALREPPYPLQEHLGFTLSAWGEDYAELELPLQPFHMNRYGIPHGGLYVTLLDTVMGYAGSWTGSAEAPQLAMTLSLTTNFVGRTAGEMLIVEGRRIGGGKSTFFTEGTVRDELGTLIATSTGTFRYRARRQAG